LVSAVTTLHCGDATLDPCGDPPPSDPKEHLMKNTKAAKMAAAAFAMAVITIGAAAPATAAVLPAADAHVVSVAATATDGDLWDDGEPAGGTGHPGPGRRFGSR
jgi:hypothetical protein